MSPGPYKTIKSYENYVELCFLFWLITCGGPGKKDPPGEGITTALVWETSLNPSRLGTLLCDVTVSFLGEADPPCVCLR